MKHNALLDPLISVVLGYTLKPVCDVEANQLIANVFIDTYPLLFSLSSIKNIILKYNHFPFRNRKKEYVMCPFINYAFSFSVVFFSSPLIKLYLVPRSSGPALFHFL